MGLDRHALAGLVDNPAAPPDLLTRLAADLELAGLLAWRDDLPEPAVARLLAHGDPGLAFALDRDGQTAATRRQIATHPDPAIRHARRDQVEADIRARERIPLPELEFFAGPGGLAGLSRHPDPHHRAAVARCWTGMPERVRRELLTDPDPEVRFLAAAEPHPPAPADLHGPLLADEVTREWVAAHVEPTPAVLRLCLASAEEVRARLAVNPALPPEIRDRLAVDPSPYVRAWVLLRQDLPEPERARLHAALVGSARDPQDEAAGALNSLRLLTPAWLSCLPPAELRVHLDSPLESFRQAAAAALPSSPGLDEHPDVQVRRIAAHRPDCPGEVLLRLVLDQGESRTHNRALVEHPNFPADAVPALTAGPAHVRALATRHPAVTEAELTALAGDAEPSVRRAVARHARLPVAVLVGLLADADRNVRRTAAANPLVPVPEMRRLLDRAGL